MPKIKVNDVNLYYEIHGQGAPIICASGFTGDHNGWQLVLRQLAEHYQVIIFDNRGIGKTDCPDYPYTVEMMAEDIVGLIKALNLDSVHLIGNSMAGCMAQVIAYRHPQLVKTIVLANSFMQAHARLRLHAQNRLELMQLNMPAAIMLQYLLLWVYSSRYLDQPGMVEKLIAAALANPCTISIAGYKAQLNALMTFDSRAWIKEIRVPCLVIASEDDLLAYPKEAEQMAQLIPESKYFCFANTGHLPHLECPDDFNRLVLEFFAQH